MVFSYYSRLSPAQKRVYRRSDAIIQVPLPAGHGAGPLAASVTAALASARRGATQAACQALSDAITSALDVQAARIRVLEARPSRTWGELHGLYTRDAAGVPPVVTVWMRTAMRRQVVAPRTFLRTLVHELGHHLDYELHGLANSFHTEGFYKRESSLMVQIAGTHGASRPRARQDAR